jgi:hypothetical protein
MLTNEARYIYPLNGWMDKQYDDTPLYIWPLLAFLDNCFLIPFYFFSDTLLFLSVLLSPFRAFISFGQSIANHYPFSTQTAGYLFHEGGFVCWVFSITRYIHRCIYEYGKRLRMGGLSMGQKANLHFFFLCFFILKIECNFSHCIYMTRGWRGQRRKERVWRGHFAGRSKAD